MTPWVTLPLLQAQLGVGLLQFGHGGDAVGDAVLAALVPLREFVLQFGHGGDAVGDLLQFAGQAAAGDASIRPRR